MKQTIEFLQRDRKINSTFKEKLEKIGLEVQYGTFSYWQGQEYVEIGRSKVWLVYEGCQDRHSFVAYRYQNDVIDEILTTIKEEMKLNEDSDKMVGNFFNRLEVNQ